MNKQNRGHTILRLSCQIKLFIQNYLLLKCGLILISNKSQKYYYYYLYPLEFDYNSIKNSYISRSYIDIDRVKKTKKNN